ncbi:ABC transporter permease [Marinovum sp. 2_MG-2023]|uniref:ABC transporter permease n=1 Tax=Roseobacteraceae TaxID=2854170 RepID=UPI001FD0B313|nr:MULTISPECIES: ABC transporter permease [Roseobacteraceae]MCJ7873917.1 ABC transporter permease [Phaeobacter sp. J2-8]MDO6730935.1 ABC transporter permease [Marinovum sp. 2_MG-2023]MDO6780162.1 ABC transporter permease [Marinovum sp. 1_MG-2023]
MAETSLRSTPFVVRLSLACLAVFVLGGLFAGWIAPHDPAAQNLMQRLAPPVFLGGDWTYPLGTDALGRDIFSRMLFATRMSLGVALLGTLIGAVIGTFLGFVAAQQNRVTSGVIMALVDAQAALPFQILVLAALALFGNALWLFVALVGIAGWETYARLIRGAVLSARTETYVQALEATGASAWRIHGRHILPNVANILIIQISLNFPSTILLETSLSFLGLGIQPPLTSLGEMLGSGRDHLLLAWWIAVVPGAAIFLITLSMSLVGDWLRDLLDPDS